MLLPLVLTVRQGCPPQGQLLGLWGQDRPWWILLGSVMGWGGLGVTGQRGLQQGGTSSLKQPQTPTGSGWMSPAADLLPVPATPDILCTPHGPWAEDKCPAEGRLGADGLVVGVARGAGWSRMWLPVASGGGL